MMPIGKPVHAFAACLVVMSAHTLMAQTVQDFAATTSTLAPTDFNRPIAGPVSVPLNKPTPTDIGVTLEKGKNYTIVVQGVGGIRKEYPAGLDPVYRFQDIGLEPGYLRPSHTFKLPAPNTTFHDLLKKNLGATPFYNPAHVYHVVVKGDGKPLTATISEKSARSYTDNSGAFVVTVYQSPLGYTDPPGSGKQTPAVDADVGGAE